MRMLSFAFIYLTNSLMFGSASSADAAIESHKCSKSSFYLAGFACYGRKNASIPSDVALYPAKKLHACLSVHNQSAVKRHKTILSFSLLEKKYIFCKCRTFKEENIAASSCLCSFQPSTIKKPCVLGRTAGS